MFVVCTRPLSTTATSLVPRPFVQHVYRLQYKMCTILKVIPLGWFGSGTETETGWFGCGTEAMLLCMSKDQSSIWSTVATFGQIFAGSKWSVEPPVHLAMMKALVSTALRLAIKSIIGRKRWNSKCIMFFVVLVFAKLWYMQQYQMSDSRFYHKLLTITYCLTIYMGEKLFWNTPCSDNYTHANFSLVPSGNRTPGSRTYLTLWIPGQTQFASTSSYSSLV